MSSLTMHYGFGESISQTFLSSSPPGEVVVISDSYEMIVLPRKHALHVEDARSFMLLHVQYILYIYRQMFSVWKLLFVLLWRGALA